MSKQTSQSVFREDCLAGKVVFISGGGTGICLGITRMLAAHGASVTIGSRRLEVVKKAAQDIEHDIKGAKALAVQLDVRDAKSVEGAVKKTLDEFGRIDVLINGAAGNFLIPAHKLSANGFKTVMEIDAMGTFLLSTEVFRKAMLPQKGGSIVNITATLHWNGELLQVHAGAAKAAIEAMTKHLANEWGRFNVRVNNIAPGPIEDTEGFRKLGGFLPDKVKTDMTEKIALRRNGKVGDIANAALFLSTDASSYMTGSTVTVDGGAWFFGGGLVGAALEKMEKLKVNKKSKL